MQGHQRAGALKNSNNFFQGTIITVHEVQPEKTVNTKLGEQTIWVSGVIKEIYRYFQEGKAGWHKKTENKVALHSYGFSIKIAKSYS